MKALLGVVAVVLLAGIVLGNGDGYTAQIFSTPSSTRESASASAKSELLGISSTFSQPENPELLNSFNTYDRYKSEATLMQLYAKDIQGASPEFVAAYANEILSYLHRMKKNPELRDKLPMWPEHNVATYGNIIAYLFPNEPNPMVFAKAKGLVPQDAKSASFMSRLQLLDIIGKIFIPSGEEPMKVLSELGFIKSQRTWNDESRVGFPLVEAIRLVLQLREIVERKNILAAKEVYADQMAYLPSGMATLSKETIQVMVNAFAQEASINDASKNDEALSRIMGRMESQFGKSLTASMITDARTIYYGTVRKKIPATYELPPVMDFGNCTNEAFRKTYMGPVAVTGPAGAVLMCDGLAVLFPANAYLLNVYSLPKISVVKDPQNADKNLLRTDVMKSYQNALVVDSNGEQQVIALYQPDELSSMVGASFNTKVTDHNDEEEASVSRKVTDKGVPFFIHLRAFSGDHFISQK